LEEDTTLVDKEDTDLTVFLKSELLLLLVECQTWHLLLYPQDLVLDPQDLLACPTPLHLSCSPEDSSQVSPPILCYLHKSVEIFLQTLDLSLLELA
jgi:hypothetical protein